MKVIANRQLHGEYGDAAPDQLFECREETAEQLLKAGLVRHALPPKVQYEIKVIKPEAPEVGPREPFPGHVSVSDAESKTVAPEGDPLFQGANLPPLGTTDPRGRGGRSGSNPRR
jgi:hypothetical protein